MPRRGPLLIDAALCAMQASCCNWHTLCREGGCLVSIAGTIMPTLCCDWRRGGSRTSSSCMVPQHLHEA
jgi:hypothetical protein